jgi:hypothetical protein
MRNTLQIRCPIEELIAEINWRTRENRLSACAIYSDCAGAITLNAIVSEQERELTDAELEVLLDLYDIIDPVPAKS